VAKHRMITFALDAQADVSASYQVDGDALLISVNALGESFDVRLAAIGEHNVRNAVAAIATAMAAQVPITKIQAGLASYRPISGRLNLHKVGDAQLIDDTYNANPLSMLAAIKVLVQYPNNTLVVGDMAELGSAVEEEHSKLGMVAAQHGVERIFACGKYADLVIDAFNQASGNTEQSRAFAEQGDLINYVTEHVVSGTILVKGSRSAQMEHVVQALNDSLLTPQMNHGRNREC